MRTLASFEHNCCLIKYLKQTSKECQTNYNNKLYKVVVTPKHKNTWCEYEKEFTYSSDAEMYMLEQIKFWLS